MVGRKSTNLIVLTLPSYTACTWCYEAMYKDDVFSSDKGKHTVIVSVREMQRNTLSSLKKEGL